MEHVEPILISFLNRSDECSVGHLNIKASLLFRTAHPHPVIDLAGIWWMLDGIWRRVTHWVIGSQSSPNLIPVFTGLHSTSVH